MVKTIGIIASFLTLLGAIVGLSLYMGKIEERTSILTTLRDQYINDIVAERENSLALLKQRNIQSGSFNLWAKNGDFHGKIGTKRIKFETAFKNIPKVHAAFQMIDADKDKSTSLSIGIPEDKITKERCEIQIKYFSTTKLYGAGVVWFAYD